MGKFGKNSRLKNSDEYYLENVWGSEKMTNDTEKMEKSCAGRLKETKNK